MILDDIVAKKRLDLIEEEQVMPLAALERQAEAAPPVRDFHAALAAPGLSVIAEIKRASPSKGMIAKTFDPVVIAKQYEDGGAAAISVLTEKHWFLGSNEYLTQVKEAGKLPVLRKDFILCERQVVETRAIGADAILLIAAILDDNTMKRLYTLASEYGLACLFEAHDAEEIKRIVGCGAGIIGINNRNLCTMQVNLATFEALRRYIPSGTIAVAESGIASSTDARRMREAGADAILVGELLMRQKDIAGALAELRCLQ